MGVLQVLSEFQETVAFVAVPVSSTRLSGDALLAPAALFQLLLAITPAISELPINDVLLPTKSMPIVPCPGVKLFTERETELVCVRLPLVPVIVSVGLPIGVLVVVVTFSVALPEPVTDAGLNNPDAPAGRPLTLRATLPVKPFSAPTL